MPTNCHAILLSNRFLFDISLSASPFSDPRPSAVCCRSECPPLNLNSLDHPVLAARRIPGLREEPVNPAIAFRNRPKEFVHPDLPYFPTEAPHRFPKANPTHVLVHGAAQQRRLMPDPIAPSVDPVLAYRRYPALNDKQMRRWSTESKDQFVNKFKSRR